MDIPLSVLVVDDEADVEWLFRKRFRKDIQAGLFAFTFAHSGEEALGVLQDGGLPEVVLVLSDINMPGMSGLELLRQIKERHPHLPVHIITAYGNDTNYRQAMAYGADGFLTKPLDFEYLRNDLLRAQS